MHDELSEKIIPVTEAVTNKTSTTITVPAKSGLKKEV